MKTVGIGCEAPEGAPSLPMMVTVGRDILASVLRSVWAKELVGKKNRPQWIERPPVKAKQQFTSNKIREPARRIAKTYLDGGLGCWVSSRLLSEKSTFFVVEELASRKSRNLESHAHKARILDLWEGNRVGGG